jgi:SAM-dependent methyltransferase
MTSEPNPNAGGTDVPSMLDLVRLSPRDLFPPGGRDLYRQIAVLTEMDEGTEVLVASCGSGVTAQFFVQEFGVHCSGADEDPVLVERAELRARQAGLQDRLQFQRGSMAALPFRDGIFDVTVAELGLTAHVEPEEAIRELVRVTRPGGRLALVQLVWKAPVDPDRRLILGRHLGARPLMLMELKRLLREEGVRHLHTEGWSDEATAFRPQITKPFPDFAELFSVPEKLRILKRAWGRWGWKGVRIALAREAEVHRLLTRERILGLDLITGRKEPPEERAERDEEEESAAAPPTEDPSTRDLPLFQSGESDT